MKIKLKKDIVAETLRQMIRNGELPRGRKLPRGTELAATFGVSHITMRAALEVLAAEGMISLVQGRGTFVTGDGHTRAGGKILIIRDAFRSLRDLSNYILPGFEKRCCELQLLTETVTGDFLANATPNSFRKILKQNGFTSILIPGGGFESSDPLAGLLRECGIPVLIAHGTILDPQRTHLPVMRTDYAGAWRDGVKFLRSCGHKRIAFLANAFFKIRYYTESEMLSNFVSLGADADPALISSALPEEKNFEASVRQLLKAKPEAIFCGSDFFAMRLCDFLKNSGIRVPEDVSVLGFGGYPGGNFCSPALTTVDFQYDAIGEKAAELLQKPGERLEKDMDIFTPHSILIRETVRKH